MTFPAVGHCTCQSPARCPRVATCAAEFWARLERPAVECDVTLRCMRPDLGAALQCPGPCPVVGARPVPAPYLSHFPAYDTGPTAPAGPVCVCDHPRGGREFCPIHGATEPAPAAEVQHWRCGTAHDREVPCP